MLVCCLVIIGIVVLKRTSDNRIILQQTRELLQEKPEATNNIQLPVAGIATVLDKTKISDVSIMKAKILGKYQSLYYENTDLVEWLMIPDNESNVEDGRFVDVGKRIK